MVVVAIVGVLSAVALPNLLGNRDRAAAQAQIGAMQAFAAQCNSNIGSENPLPLAGIPTTITTLNLVGTGANACGIIDPATGIFTPAAGPTFANTKEFPNTGNLQGVQCGINETGVPQRQKEAEDTCTFSVRNGAVIGDWT